MRDGWRAITLGDLGPIFNGNSISEAHKNAHFRGKSEGTVYLGTKDVGFDHQINYQTDIRISASEANGFKLAPANTVFVCAEGGSAGRKIAITEREVFFGNKLFAICPIEGISNKFVFYYCLTEQFSKSFKGAMAGLIGGVSLNKFKNLPIVLPPLPEQQRIVAILDEAFAGLATATANVEKNLKNARELFESYLNSAFVRNGEKEKLLPLEKLCEADRIITYGVIKLGSETPNGVPCLRTSNVRWLQIDLIGLKRISAKLSEQYGRTILRGGEVLVNVRGTLGGVAVAADEMKGWNVSREVAVVPTDTSQVLPEFLAYFIGTRDSQNWLIGVQKGVAYTGINISDLRTLPVSLPKISEQKRVVDKLVEVSTESRRLEENYRLKLLRLSQIRQSLLHAAFSGELTSPTSQTSKEAAE